MIRINLLPHREERRKERQRQFLVLLAGTAILGGAVWYAGSKYLEDRISAQVVRNDILKNEMKRLDSQIEEIKKLKDQTSALLARKQVVEALQTNRSEGVKLIDQVGRIPEGLFLKNVRQTGGKVSIVGYAQSNARVSALMRDLEVSPVLRTPELVEVKAATISNQRTNEFSLNATMRQTVVIDPGAPIDAQPKAPAASKSDAARQAIMNKVSS
jgi:type IV pilus assembly protein PilN